MAVLDIDAYVLVGYLLAANNAATKAALPLYDAIEAAAVGQVANFNGGRVITGTSSGGTQVSFALPANSVELTPTKVLKIYVALRRYCREAATGLGIDRTDYNNNNTLADAIEGVLCDTEQGCPDFTNLRE